HGINGAGTAEYFPARPISAAVVQIGIRLGAKHPVDPGIIERLAISDRHLQPKPPVADARFEDENFVPAVRAQPIRQNASRRTCADDDVIDLDQSCPPFPARTMNEHCTSDWSPPQIHYGVKWQSIFWRPDCGGYYPLREIERARRPTRDSKTLASTSTPFWI